MSASLREWILRAALVLLPPLALCGLVEAGLRVAGAGFEPSFWVPGREGFVQTNDRFGWRFFPRPVARTPDSEALLKGKPPGVRRVFVIGESAAMGFPEPAIGLARVLEGMLQQMAPEVRWQVHNAAMTAVNSHVLVDIARDCARLEPDVFVVLAGNNEAIGPYGPATVFGRAGLPLPLVRAAVWLSRTRTGQLALPHRGPRTWRGLEMFAGQHIAREDPRLDRMYAHFRGNLEAITRLGREAGAQVILATVPVNLRDCPPFGGPQELYRAGRFAEARDADRLRFRADSRIQQIIRETAASGATLADAEREFGVAGGELFYEHVHFTPEGNYRLARTIAASMVRGTAPSLETLRRTLPLTPWDEHHAAAQIAALLRRPPFSTQPGNAERLARLLPPVDLPSLRAAARPLYEAALRARPEDVHLRRRYAELLRESGEPGAAAAQWSQLIALQPGRKAWHISRGAAWSDAGEQQKAAAEFRAALAIDAELDVAHFGLGLAAARSGQHGEAIVHYRAAWERNPGYAEAAYQRAASLATLGEKDAAMAALREALAAQPQYAEAEAALGRLLAETGRDAEAVGHYQRAVEMNSAQAGVQYDLGVLLARQNRFPEAVAHYREALRIEPGYAEAWNNLGTALARSGDLAGAAAAFARALAIRPSFATARDNLERARRAGAAQR